MKTYWPHSAILIYLAFAGGTSIAQAQYRFQHYNTKEGLPTRAIASIAQDSLGFMWFQSYGVLVRFDGYKFKTYQHDQEDTLSLPPGTLGNILTDASGNVWITSYGGTSMAKYDNRSDGFIKYHFDLRNAPTRVRVEKNEPVVWLAMGSGEGLYSFNSKTHETINHINADADSLRQASRNTIRDIMDFGSSLLLTTRMGLWKFDKSTKTFSRPKCNPRDSAFLYQKGFFRILPNTSSIEEGFWLTSVKEIVRVDADFNVKQHFTFPEEEVSKISNGFQWQTIDVDSKGIFWVGTDNGLYRFDPGDNSFINLKNDPADPFSLKSNMIHDVKVDRDQNIWLATEGGISLLPRQSMEFHNVKVPGGGISAATIYSAQEMEYLIISNNSQRSFNQPKMDQRVYEILMTPIINGQISFQKQQQIVPPISALIQTFWKGKHTFWISANEVGVIGFPINPITELPEPQPAVTFAHDPSNSNTISSNLVTDIWEDPEENLWVGTKGSGLNKVSPDIPYGKEGSVVRYNHQAKDSNSISNDFIYSIFQEDEKSIWVMTDTGVDLFEIGINANLEQRFVHVFKNKEIPNTLHKASDGTLFIGTAGGLYQSRKENDQYAFSKVPILKNYEVFVIDEDSLRRLWLSNNHGTVCYDLKENIVTEFREEEGLSYFQSLSGVQGEYQTSQGTISMVDLEGISLFDPSTFRIERKKVQPALTRLEVNNLPVSLNRSLDKERFSIRTEISILDELVIDYLHNNFSLEFSAMEMTAPEKNLYQHMLEGYDPDWIETDYRNRTATYTNLPSGTYTFRVKASNHHGVWSDNERTLKVIILPPPWRTWWAYASYSLIVIGIIVWARNNLIQRERLKANLALSKVEQEKEHFELEKAKEVDKVKTSFFTNISHEFRTPLTLIKGPVQNIIDQFVDGQKEFDRQKIVDQLKLVQRNSDLLLKLINQLLDLAKLESGSLKIEKSESDIYSFVRAIASSFESFARQKNVSVQIDVPEGSCSALFDKDKVETILINLINNAVKFTPGGGKVTIDALVNLTAVAQSRQGSLSIIVSDTGIGIPEDQQSRIFERFLQVSEAHKEVGTGIGLALVKELVALMGGTIEVKSEVGKGSQFVVSLPIEIAASSGLRAPSLAEPKFEPSFSNDGQSAQSSQLATRSSEESALPHVLVVEDNTDLRHFIIESLGTEFHFLEAENGKQGLDIATNEVPDLIISDVMMPEMDGITMAGKIKKDIRTSHIPLILLTAKSTEDSKLSGLQSGADDYLTKPFNKNELLLKVRNGVSRQVKLREKLRAELMSTAPKVEVLSEDEKFLNSVKEKILERLSDEQLSVESLAEDIGMSRVQLYRKVSGLTGISVNELIRKLRLQRAAQLISQNWGPVSQVAYEVGFSNLSYFSKVFKEEFGVLPSECGMKT